MFLRLMREEKYKDLLFGDISAVTAFKRVGYMRRLLEATVTVVFKQTLLPPVRV